jgi:hypothetical protein
MTIEIIEDDTVFDKATETIGRGHPLDEPRIRPFFAAMSEWDRPLWLHPTRGAHVTDYASETKSRFEMWWCFGWPYDTSVAMSRFRTGVSRLSALLSIDVSGCPLKSTGNAVGHNRSSFSG